MRVFQHMWLTDALEPDREKLTDQVMKGKLPKTVFAVAVPENDENLLEIYAGNILSGKYYMKSGQMIIGMAESKAAAEVLAGGILKLVREKNGSFSVREYIAEAMALENGR